MATRIQNMFRNYKISSLAGVTRRILLKRKTVGFSEMANSLLLSLLNEDSAGSGISGPTCHYQCPGVRQNTAQFQRVLNQHTIYCDRFFLSEDAVLLGAILRNPLCRTRRLVLHTVNGLNPSFEFDLLPSIAQCRSLRIVAVLGGVWSVGFLQKLSQIVQLENPLIQSVFVECVHGLKTHELDQIVTSAANLLLDFFNYSVPGIRTLSLHGISLVSQDMKLLSRGLSVNTSLSHLTLSLNLIEEDGFLEIMSFLSTCKKSSLSYLDFTWNLVSLSDSVVRVLESYSGSGRTLTVDLRHNRIMVPYKPSRPNRTDLIVLTIDDPNPTTRETTPSPKKSPLKVKGRESKGRQPSKFKSTLMRNINSQLASKTM
jgi:hypothetical protein